MPTTQDNAIDDYSEDDSPYDPSTDWGHDPPRHTHRTSSAAHQVSPFGASVSFLKISGAWTHIDAYSRRQIDPCLAFAIIRSKADPGIFHSKPRQILQIVSMLLLIHALFLASTSIKQLRHLAKHPPQLHLHPEVTTQVHRLPAVTPPAPWILLKTTLLIAWIGIMINLLLVHPYPRCYHHEEAAFPNGGPWTSPLHHLQSTSGQGRRMAVQRAQTANHPTIQPLASKASKLDPSPRQAEQLDLTDIHQGT